MFLEIKGLLNPAEASRLTQLSREMKFIDGRASNPHNTTKTNFQADVADQKQQEAAQVTMGAFLRSREFMDFTMPKRIAPPLMLRYDTTQKYGVHADAAYMTIPGQGGGKLRSDVSCTVFIAEPSTYEGGELTIHLGARTLVIKGEPGDAIVYPSTTLHEVVPVRSGVRLVMITFIESLVADEAKRNLLYELNEVGALEGLKMEWQSRIRFEAARQNLLRMWSA